jgi:uncharacterized protein (TIGR03086 family)
MDVVELHERTVSGFVEHVDRVDATSWSRPTPCAGWSVRELVNHLVSEDRWTRPLLEGRTIEEVGSALEGDLLGHDPAAATRAATDEATTAVRSLLHDGSKVHLSYGEESAEEYVRQLSADHLVHAWDLCAATGQVFAPEAALVTEVAGWFVDRESLYRAAGIIAERPPAPAVRRDGIDGDLDRLLVAMGRDPGWSPNHVLLEDFVEAWSRCDLNAIMALVSDDVVFETTGPAPDGERHTGIDAVRAIWDVMFAVTNDPAFHAESSFVTGDRGVIQWLYSWSRDDGEPGHVRGIDLLRFADGKVVEKLSYAKG